MQNVLFTLKLVRRGCDKRWKAESQKWRLSGRARRRFGQPSWIERCFQQSKTHACRWNSTVSRSTASFIVQERLSLPSYCSSIWDQQLVSICCWLRKAIFLFAHPSEINSLRQNLHCIWFTLLENNETGLLWHLFDRRVFFNEETTAVHLKKSSYVMF